METTEQVREEVRSVYAAAALAVSQGRSSCCAPTSSAATSCAPTGEARADGAATACCGDAAIAERAPGEIFGAGLYAPADRAGLPQAALEASLGCGNPLLVADLAAGETVLDLGSGGGIDVLLSARRVGPTGRAYGLDMTDEMLELARRNAAEAGVSNVEFLRGHIEQIPLPGGSVDVVISNCVVNLSADKPAVFAEMFRVLRPGGRVGVSDIVAEDRLTPAERAERGEWAACVAGALSTSEYERGLAEAGFTGVEVELTHPVADGMHSAIVRAVKPS
ncbi:MAG TPA: arsenite methyltransferase [Micromonosporaceae bacterium]|nr:arsenite methyltransferase [Micromonosporaceae bacterium]